MKLPYPERTGRSTPSHMPSSPAWHVIHDESLRKQLEIAVLFDSPDENWPSMDLAAEMLLEQWRQAASYAVTPKRIALRIPRMLRQLPGAHRSKRAFNADRALTRYLGYPVRAAIARRPCRFFHVVDHSYAQLVHVLPAARTGVYCHDLDILAPLLTPAAAAGPLSWRRTLARLIAEGLRSAAVVFHNSRAVGGALRDQRLVSSSRLVHAPLGVAPEFHPSADPADAADRWLSPLEGRPFVLHVGSEIPRKRLDVALRVFAALRAARPDLRLVQQGAVLSPAQTALVDALGIRGALVQPPRLDRPTLAGLYRRASTVLLTSEAEGFGLPVIEALACGAIVVASDIPVLREVGADAALYAPVGDVPSWVHAVEAVLSGGAAVPSRKLRLARAGEFTWARHARTIFDAYQNIHASGAPNTGERLHNRTEGPCDVAGC